MEEWVGERWHQWVSRRAAGGHAEAAVTLAEVTPAVRLLLHAAGATQRLATATPLPVGGRRTWWQRVAGSGQRVPLAQLDADALALPERIAVFDDAMLNRDLYLWLAAQAAHLDPHLPWATANDLATRAALAAFPGLQVRWQRLRAAELALREDCTGPDEVRLQACLHGDAALQQALATDQPLTQAALAPVWTWVNALPGSTALKASADAQAVRGTSAACRIDGRRRARAAEQGERRAPLLLAHKGEWLKTFAEPFSIDRAEDDDDSLQDAAAAAEQFDTPTLQADARAARSRVRFDLDLPSESADDIALDAPIGGEWLPEWDPRRATLVPARVQARRFEARVGEAPWRPPLALRALAQQLRRRLALQQAAPRWRRGQRDGETLDLDAWVRHAALPVGVAAVYQRQQRAARDLATLLLADLSVSTDSYADSDRRVIEVIRDSLYTFGEALSGSGDAFALLGFSSLRRQLRLHELKTFDERWGPRVHARLGALQPGYYTRLGAALRAATLRLQGRPERQRLLLLLTDGKPHDLDGYDGRLGREDTREAVREARAAGLTPFAISIDTEPPNLLPELFGAKGYAWVRRPVDLPQRLAGLYGQLLR
ncbi:nitric oxide reductase activation protein NorD [Roseateles sp.]|uniref:nitric oxide reductase activation protein NorD n=1 Tax=Roseateles sp. TaxID=1971397 RepID=UPI0039468099